MEQNKTQNDLDRQPTKSFALSWGNVSIYEISTGKDVLPGKDLLEKPATMKRFVYSPLRKELKVQTDIAKKQFQKLNDTYEISK